LAAAGVLLLKPAKLARLEFVDHTLTAEEHSIDAPKYRAFISYSHRDSGWASWLHSSLEKYRPPKSLIGTVTVRGEVPKRIAPIFRDRDELPSATDLGSLINAALAESACQIVICSPQAAQSKWVNEEILAFKRLGREDRIFCLIVGGEPNATDIPRRRDEASKYHQRCHLDIERADRRDGVGDRAFELQAPIFVFRR
jgi:MTH538 TIR-like domain (DUF1863)